MLAVLVSHCWLVNNCIVLWLSECCFGLDLFEKCSRKFLFFFSFLLSFGFMLLHHLYAFCVEGILRYLNFWLGFSLYCCSLPIFIRLHVISLIFLFFYFFPSLPFSIALSFSLALSQFQTYKNPLKFFVEEANKTGEKKT